MRLLNCLTYCFCCGKKTNTKNPYPIVERPPTDKIKDDKDFSTPTKAPTCPPPNYGIRGLYLTKPRIEKAPTEEDILKYQFLSSFFKVVYNRACLNYDVQEPEYAKFLPFLSQKEKDDILDVCRQIEIDVSKRGTTQKIEKYLSDDEKELMKLYLIECEESKEIREQIRYLCKSKKAICNYPATSALRIFDRLKRDYIGKFEEVCREVQFSLTQSEPTTPERISYEMEPLVPPWTR